MFPKRIEDLKQQNDDDNDNNNNNNNNNNDNNTHNRYWCEMQPTPLSDLEIMLTFLTGAN